MPDALKHFGTLFATIVQQDTKGSFGTAVSSQHTTHKDLSKTVCLEPWLSFLENFVIQ
jgi:hypothetical protein